jgi:hypothetical protein
MVEMVIKRLFSCREVPRSDSSLAGFQDHDLLADCKGWVILRRVSPHVQDSRLIVTPDVVRRSVGQRKLGSS